MNAIVFLLSAAILAYEVVLMRMFSIAQWHHFASMVISIALLGFGLSGTVLSIWRERLRNSFVLWAMGFVLAAPVCAWLAQQIPFTPLLMLWQPIQLGYLLCLYVLLTVPFSCGALAIGLALIRARESQSVGRTYAANLIGSGLGAMAGLALCYLPVPARMSEFKGLQKAMQMAGSRIVQTSYHPLGRLDVVDNPALRVAPGLSIAYAGAMPRQQVLFVDGDGGSAVNLVAGDDLAMKYVDWLPSAVAYVVRPGHKFLVIGVGGGTELHQAARQDAHELTGVELHPHVARLAAANAPWADVRVAEGRAFIRRSRDRYDVIQISLLDSLAATAVGVGAANESYLYTVEAMNEFLDHLTDAGVLCITRWLKAPPRDNIKLFATAVTALERRGVREAGKHLMFVRGWATGTLLVKRTPFSQDEVARVREWAEQRVFDVDYFPGATEQDVNVRNVMAEPVYFRAAQAILIGDRERFYREHLFAVRPATDERPYFFHFFRWRSAPHLLRTMGTEWVPFVEWGYVVLVATLAQAAVASVVLIGLPLLVANRRMSETATRRWPVLAYFAALGMGFMFLEMALLQKFTLFLGNPLYAAATVIGTFLVFAGAGAAQAGRRVRDARWPAMAIVLLALLSVPGLPAIFRAGLGWPEAARFAMTSLLLALPAFFMGMMFPLGLSKISEPIVPLAWGVNGCLSVIGVVLAATLAMDFGFTVVIGAAVVVYGCAAAAYQRLA
jgi:spermidine synthase